MVAFFVFLLIPFMYFYFEEKDDDVSTGKASRNHTYIYFIFS